MLTFGVDVLNWWLILVYLFMDKLGSAVDVSEQLECLGRQYEDLPDEKRLLNGRVTDWTRLLEMMPKGGVLEAALGTLVDPRVYFLNGNHRRLVIGDGGESPPESTFGFEFNDVLDRERVYFAAKGNGEVVTANQIWHLPPDVGAVVDRGLILWWEYEIANAGQFEPFSDSLENLDVSPMTWLHVPGNMGSFPSPTIGFYAKGQVTQQQWQYGANRAIGARRVIRVPLSN